MAINMSVVFYVLISVCHLASVSTSSTSQATCISCPGDVLTIECTIMGRGATVWQGTAFQCGSSIILRHSQFGGSYNSIWTCNDGAIVAQALGIVNNSYVSQLNVTVSLELNNTTVECWHSYNLTDTVIKRIQIVVLVTGKQEKVQTANVYVDIKVKGHTCAYTYTRNAPNSECLGQQNGMHLLENKVSSWLWMQYG